VTEKLSLPSRAVALSALSLALLPAFGAAQDPTNLRRGRSVPTAYAADQHDAVNLYNGNYSVSIGIGEAYAVSEALAYALSVQYNSNVWDFDWGPEETVNAFPELYGNAGLGWNLGLARLKQVGTPATACTNWIVVEADGSRRQIFSSLHLTDPVTSACFTRDGSYLRIKKAGSDWEVESPNGLVRVFDSSGRLKTIRDRFSNTVSLQYLSSPTRWQLTDSTGGGRTHVVEFETPPGLPERVKKVELARFGTSARATWTFNYILATIDRHWKHSSEGVKGGLPGVVQVQLLASVAPPVGGAYQMEYFTTNVFEPPPSGYFSPSGSLLSFRLPTKGRYEYKYRTFSFGTPPSSAPWTAQSDGLGSKSVFSASGTFMGEWTYRQGPRPDGSVPANPGREIRTWVKTPEHGDVSVHFFTTEGGSWKNGLPFSDQIPGGGAGQFLSKRVYEGDPSAAGATLVRTEWVKYNADYHDGSATGRENQRLESSRLEFNDDPGKFADVTLSNFDGLGHYRTVSTDGNFGNGDESVATTNFNATSQNYVWDANLGGLPPPYVMLPVTTAWVLDRFDFTQVSEGSSTFRSDYSFDVTTGFLNSVRSRKVAGELGTNDVLAYFCPSAAGGFLERESYFGGDTQSLTGISPSCAGTGPSSWVYRIDHGYSYGQRAWSQHRATNTTFLPHRDYQVDIDQWTGKAKSSYDISGYKTNYDFDSLGRLTTVEPVGSGGGEKGAITTYAWGMGSGSVGLNATLDTKCPSGVSDCASGASFGQTELSWDGFGRLTRETQKQSDGTLARRDTFWNALGWMTQTSVLGPNAGGNRSWVFYDFDAFGRPRKIDLPDKSDPGYSNHRVVLSYTGDRVAARKTSIATNLQTGAEADFETTHTFDRQGRLVQIQQPLSSGSLKTTYGYNAVGTLTSVAQGPASGSPIQSRSMTIDGRGFLIQETHPEKGGTITYSDIDARGHAHIIDDVGSSGRLSLVYDKAERTTAVWEGSSPSRVLKQWTYGSGGTSLGKVQTAVRYNYFPAISNTAIVTETYSYGGAFRLPTARSTRLYVSAQDRERFDQTFTWNRDGTLDQQTYPRCFEGGCGAGVAGRTVEYNYKEGFLIEIPAFTTIAGGAPPFPIEYHKSGMMKVLRHANSVTETIAADPSGLPRRTNLTLTSPILNGSIGAHAYDGEGNLKTQGLNDFAYDGGSRLVSAFMGIGAHNKTQDFTMDLVGNITKITTNGVQVPIPTASSSNRLNGGGSAYDSRGNLIDWNGQHYEYDRLNKMTRSCVTWSVSTASCTSQDWVHVYTADDERMWQYRIGVAGSIFTLRGLDRKVLRTHDSSQGVNAFTDSVWANGQLLATVTSAGTVAHWHTDELGTPIVQTNPAGGVQASYAYFPYGEEINQAVVDAFRFRFTAHERDLGTQPGTADDRDYMHQRSTLPQLGRFLSVDPIGGNPFNPQSWNRYTYALNNPLKYIDPLGLNADDENCSNGETCTSPPPGPPPPPTVGPTNGPNSFNPPRPGSGNGGGGGGGPVREDPTQENASGPCTGVQRFEKMVDSAVAKFLPIEVTLNASRPPLATSLSLSFSATRQISLYVGGGFGAGRGGVSTSGRFAGGTIGPGLADFTTRFSFSSAPFIAGVLGIGASAALSQASPDLRLGWGFGPSGGPSSSFTGGYTFVSEPVGKELEPCN
jgi:RHS repeat-associated protein